MVFRTKDKPLPPRLQSQSPQFQGEPSPLHGESPWLRSGSPWPIVSLHGSRMSLHSVWYILWYQGEPLGPHSKALG
jgi:hypothetical protein